MYLNVDNVTDLQCISNEGYGSGTDSKHVGLICGICSQID